MVEKEALDLLRKYIDLQIALEIRSEQAARLEYYDESLPLTSREAEETWAAFAAALRSADDG